jgi:transposase InsO family protein
MRFAFIAAEKATFPVRLLCRVLQVSRGGFYAWQTRSPAARGRADERLGLEIAAIHAESRQRYGSPRIHAELVDRGCRTSRKRVARLMRVRGLAARRRRRFRVTTQSRHSFPLAPNVLARQFERAKLDQAWVTDITYIPTGGDPRSLLALRRGLGHERAHHGRSHPGCSRDGARAAAPAAGPAASFGSWQSIRQPRLPRGPGPARDRVQHEPPR